MGDLTKWRGRGLDIFMHQVNTYAMTEKARRQQRILDLLDQRPIRNQAQLREFLGAEGIECTQATLSRDLHELGVVKGPSGYTISRGAVNVNSASPTLERTLRDFLVTVDRGENMVVLHTGPGRAQPLALELDRARLRGVLGTVAGDDTIFIAARSSRDAGSLVKNFQRYTSRPQPA